MPRSTKDSDDETESKTGRKQIRMLSSHMVNSPLRRSSRIKQAKTSPGSSESDNSNSQPIRVTRQRTATMDSIVSETVKKRLTRHSSVSSDLNEATDIDVIGTPTKRRTKNSLSVITPTNVNTRAANKRLTRAGSETKSPPYIVIRKTRSSSVEPESSQEQNKSRSGTPVRIRRRASMLPSGSPVKEEIEERNVTPVRLNPTITEMEEVTDKIAIVPVLLKSDEILSLTQNKSKIQNEHMDQITMNKEQTVVEGQSNSEGNLLLDISTSDESSVQNNSSNFLKSNKEDTPKESLLQIEESLINMCQDTPKKDLAENSLNTVTEEELITEEQKKNNKENQPLNISDASAKKNIQPIISSVLSLNTTSLTSLFMNKLDEIKEKSEETNNTSLMNQTETQEKNDSKTNLDTDITEDSNEMELMLEERSPSRHENEAPSNVTNFDNLDLSLNKTPLENSKNQSNMDEQSAVDDVINNAESTKQEQNLSEHETKSQSESSNFQIIDLESNDSDDSTIQDNQPSDITETSEKPAADISRSSIISVSSQPSTLAQETESKDVSSKSILKRKSTCDVLETEEESLQLEKNKKNQEDTETVDEDSKVNIAIKLFHNIIADEEKENDESNDVNTVNSTHQSEKKQESEAECDLILMNKQAWLAAKAVKAREEKESFEYDSDDTVLLKSQLDAAQESCKAKVLDIVSEESVDTVLLDNKEDEDRSVDTVLSDDKEDKAVEEIKKQKSLTKKRSISKQKNSSPECTDDEAISITVVKSKTSLNKSNNQSTSKLNNSRQAAEATEQTRDNSDEEAEDDTNGLNRSCQVNKKNISLQKSKDGRKSLNKSLTNTSINQDENSRQMLSINKSQMDISEEDNTDAYMEKSLQQKKRSLNKLHDNETVADAECTEKELSNEDNKNASLNRSRNNKSKMIRKIDILDSDDSDNKSNNDKMAQSPSKSSSSTIAHAGTDYSNSASIESLVDPLAYFSKINESTDDDTDDGSINSDIKKEYNLDGKKQKFSDDNVAGDECRASESESSDSNDNGSDLASFIVSDVEDEIIEDEWSGSQGDDYKGEVLETINEKNEVENKDEEDEQSVEESDEDEKGDIEIVSDEKGNKDERNTYLDTEKEDENLSEDVDIETMNESIVNKDNMRFMNKLKKLHNFVETSTPKHSDIAKRTYWSNEALLSEKSKNLKKNTSLKEFNRTSDKEKRLNKSLPSVLSNTKIEAHVKLNVKTDSARLNKTMDDFDMSTIRFLRKEKLNESAPLRLDIKNTSLKKKSLLRQETNIIETKGENSEEEISNLSSNLMASTDNAIRKHNRQKKNKKKAEKALNEDITDQDQENIESKPKNEVANRSPIVKDTISKDSKQINKKKKKKKQINVIEQNENVSEDDTASSMPVTQKKKKLAQHTEESDKINKKKKQIGIIEQEKSINKDKKNVRRNETELSQRNKKKVDQIISSLERDRFTDDEMIAERNREEDEMLKSFGFELVKRRTLLEESTKNNAQTKRKKKINKKEICDQIMPLSDDTIQKHSQKKRKRQMEEALNEDDDEAASQYPIKTKRNKRVKFVATAEETKFDKQGEPLTKDDIYEELHQVLQKRKNMKKKQLGIIEQLNIIKKNDMYASKPVGEKKKKKQQQQQLGVSQQDENINEEEIDAPKPIGEKIKRAKHSPTLVIKRNKRILKNKNFLSSQPASADNNTIQDLRQIIERKKKKKQLDIIEQDNNIIEDDTYASKHVGEKKKKKKKQLGVSQQDILNEEDTYIAEPVKEKKKKKKKQLSVTEHDYVIMEDDTYVSEPVEEKKKKKQLGTNQQDNINEARTYAPERVEKKKKKKQLDVSQYDDTYASEPIGEKKKKKKKHQLGTNQQDNNINEENTYAPETVEKKKKKKNQLGVIQQDNNINKDDMHAPMLIGQKKKKKNKEKQIEQDRSVTESNPKLKLKKNLQSGKKSQVQNIVPHAIERTDITETWNEARQAIRAAEMRIKTNKELKKRKRSENDENDIEKRAMKIKEKKKLVPSSMDNVKRLSNDVIENLSDIPKKKKRKFLRNEEQISDSPKKKKPKATIAKNDSELLLNVPNSSTQFTVINTQKAKKQSLKGAAVVASLRQKMFDKNNREPVSAYMMYLEKQRTASNKKAPKNVF